MLECRLGILGRNISVFLVVFSAGVIILDIKILENTPVLLVLYLNFFLALGYRSETRRKLATVG